MPDFLVVSTGFSITVLKKICYLLINVNVQGFWALCQNCHLGLEYMSELANFILEMESPHPDFRVWITTEPHPDFPISLLQMSIKFTYEPPQGGFFIFIF